MLFQALLEKLRFEYRIKRQGTEVITTKEKLKIFLLVCTRQYSLHVMFDNSAFKRHKIQIFNKKIISVQLYEHVINASIKFFKSILYLILIRLNDYL